MQERLVELCAQVDDLSAALADAEGLLGLGAGR